MVSFFIESQAVRKLLDSGIWKKQPLKLLELWHSFLHSPRLSIHTRWPAKWRRHGLFWACQTVSLAGIAAQWLKMHWSIVALRINRLYGALQKQTNTEESMNADNAILGCVKFKTPPPDVYNMRRLQIFISFIPFNNKCMYKPNKPGAKKKILHFFGTCRHGGMLIFPQMHTQIP